MQLQVFMDLASEGPRPTWLELLAPSDTREPFSSTVLHVAIGADYSSLVFYEPGGKGDRYDSVGAIAPPDDGEFDDFGEAVLAMPGSIVDIASARQAATEFLQTGRRPSCIAWSKFDLSSEEWLQR